MFSVDKNYAKALRGLPKKTLYLTFDDGPGETVGEGPGPKTVKIAEYLNSENIEATFFVSGKNAAQYPHILSTVNKLGHLIGNHTYNHPDLANVSEHYDVVSEIILTNKLIAPYIKNNTVHFRAPYCAWSTEAAKKLNNCLYKETPYEYSGPYNVDVDGSDWAYWQKGKSAEECAENYLNLILKKKNKFFNKTEEYRKHIILMHDSTADDDEIKKNNLTFEMLKIIIPVLKAKGYNFSRLDKISATNISRRYSFDTRLSYNAL